MTPSLAGQLAAVVCLLLCRAADAQVVFSAAVAEGNISQVETSVLFHALSAGAPYGLLNHWWITGGSPSVDYAIISFYIDGEVTPSLRFNPGLACGTGFDDDSAVPWAIEYFGKQATVGAWHNNLKVPFQKSINITYRAGAGQPNDSIYMIVRGVEGVPLSIGGWTLSPAQMATARLQLQVVTGTFAPLAYITVADVPTGAGAIFLHTLSFAAGNLATLEGCYRVMTPHATPYPGQLLSSGTEDYFASAYYFNAGEFRGPTSGLTHLAMGPPATLSAYRVHAHDPLAFTDGIRMVYRNGDTLDPVTGRKCILESGGNVVGSPSAINMTAYTWVYVW